MRKFCAIGLIIGSLFFASGCGKKAGEGQNRTEPPGVVEEVAPLAGHLGFASRVPKDADMFVAGFHADKMLRGLVGNFVKPGEVDDADMKEFNDIMSYVGDEVFLFVGPGAGVQIEMLAVTYRDLSSAWAGFASDAMLDGLSGGGGSPDFSKLQDAISSDFVSRWIDAIEKDKRLSLPSIVVGWKPAAEKETECRDAVGKWLDELFIAEESAKPVTFEASGVAFKGYEIEGRGLFADVIAGAREELSKQAATAELYEMVSPEQLERVLSAFENLRLTVAAGSVEGRVLIYIGNGSEGFQLAGSPDQSLAAIDGLVWTREFSENTTHGALYLSEPMVRSVLPLMDSSAYWQALSNAVGPPVKQERLFKELLNRLSTNMREHSKRDASAWAAIAFEDGGLHLQSRGGWPDPGLDYQTPLRMREAASSLEPAIRAHWVQNRGRNDLSWERLEIFGHLIESVITELRAGGNASVGMLPEETMARISREIVEINRAYRDEFRAGIGDEVAFVADFQGEVPPIPGLSEETVKSSKAPRFLVARAVKDRAMLSACGKSYNKSWRSLTAWATEVSGENIPLIVPQSIESGGLTTWYPPLPFIGGDFMPGITLNDELWMMGVSRSMADRFSKAMKTSTGGNETGMVLEIDFAAVIAWSTDVYERNKENAEALTADAPDDVMELAEKANLQQAEDALRSLRGLTYRHWMEDGKPRTSLHIRTGSGE